MSEEIWFWVTPADDVDALGDYGGFTFQTYEEAVEFVQAEYKEWFRLQDSGYYEAESSPSLLQVETVRSVAVEIIETLK